MTVTVIVAVAVTGGSPLPACLPVLPRQGVAWPAWGPETWRVLLAWR